MKASIKFLFRQQAFPQLTVPAIKFRGRNLTLLKLCHALFPHTTLLFLYRDAISYSASWVRVRQRLGTHDNSNKIPLEEFLVRMKTVFAPISLEALGLGHLSGPLSAPQYWALVWLTFMDYYLRQTQKGLPITAWRYADLNHKRQETLHRLFATCGLPADAVQPALAGFAQDSQKGTVMARTAENQGNPLRRTKNRRQQFVRSSVVIHSFRRQTSSCRVPLR